MKAAITKFSKSSGSNCVFPDTKPLIMKNSVLVILFRFVTPFSNINKLVNVRATPVPTLLDIKAELAGLNIFWYWLASRIFGSLLRRSPENLLLSFSLAKSYLSTTAS